MAKKVITPNPKEKPEEKPKSSINSIFQIEPEKEDKTVHRTVSSWGNQRNQSKKK